MTDEPATEWVVVANQTVPWPRHEVLGRYATEADAVHAAEQLRAHPQWFCTYTVERRLRG